MVSTRWQRTKGKSLCLTDFFSHNESADCAPPDLSPSGARSSSTSPAHSLVGEVLEVGPEQTAPVSLLDCQPTQTKHNPHRLKRSTSVQTSNKTATARSSSACCEPYSSLGPSTTSSPVKHKAKLDVPDTEMTATSPPQADELGMFPVTDQALSPALLKDMMLAFRFLYPFQPYSNTIISQSSYRRPGQKSRSC